MDNQSMQRDQSDGSELLPRSTTDGTVADVSLIPDHGCAMDNHQMQHGQGTQLEMGVIAAGTGSSVQDQRRFEIYALARAQCMG